MHSGETELTEKLAAAGAQNRSPSAQETARLDSFARRHIGPNPQQINELLEVVGYESLDALIEATIPKNIRLNRSLRLPSPQSENDALDELRSLARRNKVARSFIGAGYSDCLTPPVIQRNILENPGWYTAYTPYQAELAQGRLEALLNFQTMITDLTALDIANASLLDEATAAAEAMALCHAVVSGRKNFFAAHNCHPQTIAVVRTRAKPLGIEVVLGNFADFGFNDSFFGALVQYPATDGAIHDYRQFVQQAHEAGALVVVAADILALTLLRPPGEFGADVAVGSTQRFGVPLGFGGPHAAYFATRDQFKRYMPGRLVGISHDAEGRPGYRLALQTREQHIRRDKATSNICTAQVLLAVIASMYAVYHGPSGLRAIAERVHRLTSRLAATLRDCECQLAHENFFDTIRVEVHGQTATQLIQRAAKKKINLRKLSQSAVGISLDETTKEEDIAALCEIFGGKIRGRSSDNSFLLPASALRSSEFLTHPVFNSHHTETEMLRYLRRLESRDLSLTTSMIPLGSCTMKLNATAEMFPLSWPEISKLHPFAPSDQTVGYQEICRQLEDWLAEITGFAAVSLQPNAGSQGEYAGLLAIRAYHSTRGEAHRDICIVPTSAHGTNPASAVMAGFKVVTVACLKDGDIDLTDLRGKAEAHKNDLAALMVTYPSTHGVFETTNREICEVVHSHGGQVYMDGANMNAQVGLCRPADIGADVCHLNLHKTFCIPHGGGGPGVGPIGVAQHLAPFLPRQFIPDPETGRIVFGEGEEGKRPLTGDVGSDSRPGGGAGGNVSAAPLGSASILAISWMYIRMMGPDGLTNATKAAILNANYIAKRLDSHFPVLFKGKRGLVAHECILDLRQWKRAGVEVEDVAKRLMDYGFHAPTVSWPVAGTMMVEPTESESKAELDRFCDAMIAIRAEIEAITSEKADRQNNLLKNAPHTAQQIAADKWDRPYSREQAAFPAPWTREHKFWPAVARIDNVYGDRNLVCSCPPMEDLRD